MGLVDPGDATVESCKKAATMRWVKMVNVGVLKRHDADPDRIKEACVTIGRLFSVEQQKTLFFTDGICDRRELRPRVLGPRSELATKLHMFGGDSFKDVHEELSLDASWEDISAKIDTLGMSGSVVNCLSGDGWVEIDEDSFRNSLDYKCEPILLVDYTLVDDFPVVDDLRQKVYGDTQYKNLCPGDGALCAIA